MTNVGDVLLSAVIVSDDLADDAVYVSGDDGNDFLEVGEIWIFTAKYVVTFNARVADKYRYRHRYRRARCDGR